MWELAVIALLSNAGEDIDNSALPDSPVVPARPPGRTRRRTAGALHRLATRLDGTAFPRPATEIR